MLSVLRHQSRFYQDQLYNPRAGDAGMWDFYRRVIADHWKVHRSADNGLPGLCSNIYAFPAFSFLAAAHRLPWTMQDGDCRLYSSRTTPAFHRIPVLACGPWDATDSEHAAEPMWARRARNYVFKILRARLCRQWLARVRLEIGRAQHMGVSEIFWCKDGVPDVIAAQLEAWFAAVPHEEVQWSEHDDWLRRYRVTQW